MVSFSTRSATRMARALRCETSPARLASLSPCTTTGVMMAMNPSATSTSASVKPARRPALTAVRRGVLTLNSITHLGTVQRNPDRRIICILNGNAADAHGVIDAAIRRKINRGQPGLSLDHLAGHDAARLAVGHGRFHVVAD